MNAVISLFARTSELRSLIADAQQEELLAEVRDHRGLGLAAFIGDQGLQSD